MTISELLRLVWLNTMENKFKVLLTSLGIIVGALTIIMVIAIGRGSEAEIADQFKNLNAGAIDITYKLDSTQTATGESGAARDMAGAAMAGGGGAPTGGGTMPTDGTMPSGGTVPSGAGGNAMFRMGSDLSQFMQGKNDEKVVLSDSEVEDIELFVPQISSATISASAKTDVEGGNLEEAAQYTVAGVKNNYSEVSNLKLSVGEFITAENDTNIERVCVLGSKVAEEIFGTAMDAYDSVIFIDGRSYVVNGILETMGTVSSGISPDESIFIPYSTAKKYVLGSDISPTITAIASDVSKVDSVKEDIAAVLALTYPNANFTITDAGSKMKAAASSAKTLSMMLIAIAAIVFFVGGIGIMNVLFVSVKERTSEIGVLKAIGCAKKDILLEFLLEAGMISCVGGLLGILISVAAMPVAEMLGLRVAPSIDGWLIALAFAILTGTIFGFYPAWEASRLVPVEALNQND